MSALIDANTLQLDDGTSVRLIGALVPRSEAAVAKRIAANASRTLERIVLGQDVRLSFPAKNAKRDRYGRRLALVFREQKPGEPRALLVQAELLRRGLARAYGLPGLFACHEMLLTAERAARDAKRGLWAASAFAPRPAKRAGALRQYRGTYQLIEGRIVRASKFRRGHYLDFGDNWRRDFTILVPYEVAKARAAFEQKLDAAVGQKVRVRGWIEMNNGPTVILDDPRQLEWLDAPSPATGAGKPTHDLPRR